MPELPSPVQFAELMFGWKAFDYQIAPLNDMGNRVVFACGRQVGKSEMAAIKAIYFAIMNPDSIVLIISKTQRQAGLLFRRIKYFINRNSRKVRDGTCSEEILINNAIERETQTVIELNNGSSLYSLPATEDGSNLRGFFAHYIIIDEAPYIPDTVFTTVRPMLATTQGKLLLLGSPNGVNNFFYRAFSDKKEGYNAYHATSYESPIIDKVFLETEKDTLSDVPLKDR
jgi:hypothetical protein